MKKAIKIPKNPPVHTLIDTMNKVFDIAKVGTITTNKNIGKAITIATTGGTKVYLRLILLN